MKIVIVLLLGFLQGFHMSGMEHIPGTCDIDHSICGLRRLI
jgi:hypothetical protein